MDGGWAEALVNLVEYPLLWRVLLNAAAIAAIAAWLGVQILARGIVFLGLAVAQGAAAGMTLAFWIGLYPLLGSLLLVGGTVVALASPRFQLQEGHEEGKIAILYTIFLALAGLFLVLNPRGEGRMQYLFYGNVLTIATFETLTLWSGAALLLGLQTWRWKAFLWLAADPRTAPAFGVPFRRFNVVFFLMLGAGLALSLHFAGLVVPLALMIVPAYTAFHTVTGLRAVLVVSLSLAILPTVLAVAAGIAFAPNYPVGSMIAIATLAASLAFFAAHRLAHLWTQPAGGGTAAAA
jgi:ABC-type Mn2+/Zn2+ transport system permease subunit